MKIGIVTQEDRIETNTMDFVIAGNVLHLQGPVYVYRAYPTCSLIFTDPHMDDIWAIFFITCQILIFNLAAVYI